MLQGAEKKKKKKKSLNINTEQWMVAHPHNWELHNQKVLSRPCNNMKNGYEVKVERAGWKNMTISKEQLHSHTHSHAQKTRDMSQRSFLGSGPMHDFSFTLYPRLSTFSLEDVHYFYDEKLSFITKY